MDCDCVHEDDGMEMWLKPKHEAFCQAYVADPKRNATKAAIAAGYKENSAAVTVCRILKKANIRSRIRELEREALAAAGYEAEHIRAAVMRELVRLAFSDISDIIHVSPDRNDPRREETLRELARVNGGQRILDFGEVIVVPTVSLPMDVTAAIKSIKCVYSKGGAFKGFEFDMHDKMNAIRVLAEASGLIKNQLALTDADGGPVSVRWMRSEDEAVTGGSDGEMTTDE